MTTELQRPGPLELRRRGVSSCLRGGWRGLLRAEQCAGLRDEACQIGHRAFPRLGLVVRFVGERIHYLAVGVHRGEQTCIVTAVYPILVLPVIRPYLLCVCHAPPRLCQLCLRQWLCHRLCHRCYSSALVSGTRWLPSLSMTRHSANPQRGQSPRCNTP